MTNLPNLGDRLHVWPALGVRVQDGADKYGVFMAPDGRDVVWDAYWHRRYLEGAVHLGDPAPASASANGDSAQPLPDAEPLPDAPAPK